MLVGIDLGGTEIKQVWWTEREDTSAVLPFLLCRQGLQADN